MNRRAMLAATIGLGITPLTAMAQGPALRLPAAIAYGRFDASGRADMTGHERQAWEQVARRIGPAVSRMEPFQSSGFLPMQAPELDGGAAAALAARSMAARSGYDYVLLYALIQPEKPVASEPEHKKGLRGAPQRIGKKVKWVFHKVAPGPAINTDKTPSGPVRGEAHLLDVSGGNPIVSSWAEAPVNTSWGVFRDKVDPETVILEKLTSDMERRLQQLMRRAYAMGRSIAD